MSVSRVCRKGVLTAKANDDSTGSSMARPLAVVWVVVIDDDWGTNGRAATSPGRRPARGVDGAVFAVVASRLARNSGDGHHRIDRCGMTDRER